MKTILLCTALLLPIACGSGSSDTGTQQVVNTQQRQYVVVRDGIIYDYKSGDKIATEKDYYDQNKTVYIDEYGNAFILK